MTVRELKHTSFNKMEVIQEEIVEYRVYKEKPYLNSAKEPFGLTINGKNKEYIKAHEIIWDLVKKRENLYSRQRENEDFGWD